MPDDFNEGNVSQHVCIIRPRRKRILPAFLAAFLSTPAIQQEIRLEQNGASREGLTLHSIRSFKIALPSIPQQVEVLQRIAGETRRSAIGAVKARAEIDLVREYRTRLVADVVTGKLDVRVAVAHVPEEVAEAEETGSLAGEDLLADESDFAEEEQEAALEEVEA